MLDEGENDPTKEVVAYVTNARYVGADARTNEMIFILEDKEAINSIPLNTKVRLRIQEIL